MDLGVLWGAWGGLRHAGGGGLHWGGGLRSWRCGSFGVPGVGHVGPVWGVSHLGGGLQARTRGSALGVSELRRLHPLGVRELGPPPDAIFSSKPPKFGPFPLPSPLQRLRGDRDPRPLPHGGRGGRRRRGRCRASAGACGRGGRGEEVCGWGGVLGAASPAFGNFCRCRAPRPHWQRPRRG